MNWFSFGWLVCGILAHGLFMGGKIYDFKRSRLPLPEKTEYITSTIAMLILEPLGLIVAVITSLVFIKTLRFRLWL